MEDIEKMTEECMKDLDNDDDDDNLEDDEDLLVFFCLLLQVAVFADSSVCVHALVYVCMCVF